MQRQFAGPREQNESIGVQIISLSNPDPAFRRLGEYFDVRGDWLYVDPLSTGNLRADFFSQGSSDYQSFALNPGAVIATPFVRIRVYQLYCLGTGAFPGFEGPRFTNVFGQQQVCDTPQMRIFFGSGRCPFQTATDTRGAAMIQPDSIGGPLSASFNIQEGMLIRNAYAEVTLLAGTDSRGSRATLRWLGPSGEFTDPGTGGITSRIAPDFQSVVESTVALAGYAQFGWRDLIVPRHATRLRMEMTQVVGGGSTSAAACVIVSG